MQLEYIDENLRMIIENPDSVLYLKPYDMGNKKALFAIVKESEGIYKKVQITKEESKMRFPFEPILWFYRGPGYFYLKDFIVLDNWTALNTTHLEGFKHKELTDSKVFDVGIFATFNDGSATFIKRNTTKEFQKRGGIELYINLLKQYKEYSPQHDNHYIIDNHFGQGNTSVIPELLSPTSLQFEELDYQDLLYKDENGNVKDNGVIPLHSVKESVKKLGRKKR